jgi:hypothetical protein
MLGFCHWSTRPAAEGKPIAAGTTNSKAIILQVIADLALTYPERKMPLPAESGKRAKAAREGVAKETRHSRRAPS